MRTQGGRTPLRQVSSVPSWKWNTSCAILTFMKSIISSFSNFVQLHWRKGGACVGEQRVRSTMRNIVCKNGLWFCEDQRTVLSTPHKTPNSRNWYWNAHTAPLKIAPHTCDYTSNLVILSVDGRNDGGYDSLKQCDKSQTEWQTWRLGASHKLPVSVFVLARASYKIDGWTNFMKLHCRINEHILSHHTVRGHNNSGEHLHPNQRGKSQTK